MLHIDQNSSYGSSLSERIGFWIYRLTRSFHKSKPLPTLPAIVLPDNKPRSGFLKRLWARLINQFNKLLDFVFKLIEPLFYSSSKPQINESFKSYVGSKIKETLTEIIDPFMELTESIYLALFHSYRSGQKKAFSKLADILRKNRTKLFFIILVSVGYLLAKGLIAFPPRHMVIYVLLPIAIVAVFSKPIFGISLYLLLTLSALQFYIWDFPGTIMGMPMYLSTPILLATMLSWVVYKVRKRERFKAIYDSNNSLIIGLWCFLTIAFTFVSQKGLTEGQSMYDYLPFANWFVVFFVIIYIIGDDKKKFFYILYAITGIYAYFIYKIIRSASYFGFGTDYTVTAGLVGQMSDNNELAACITMSVPLFCALFLAEKTKFKKTLFLAGFLASIVAIIYTRSRGSYVGLAVIFTPIVYKLILSSKNKFLPIAFLCLSFLLGYSMFHEKIDKRAESIMNWQNDPSARNRIISVIVAWEMIKDSPIIGQGVGVYNNFLEFCPEEMVIRTGFNDDDVLWLQRPDGSFVLHNAYASIGARFGLPALIFFVWLIIHSRRKLKLLRQKIPFNDENAWIHYISHALGLSILAYAVTGIFLNNPHQGFIYIIYAISTSLCYITLKPERKHNWGVTLMGVILFGLWVFFTVGYRA